MEARFALLRINSIINQFLSQSQKLCDLKQNVIQLSQIIDLDENQTILNIILDELCRETDPEIYKYLSLEFVVPQAKEREQLMSTLGDFKIGVVMDHYDQNEELLIFFTAQTFVLGQFI